MQLPGRVPGYGLLCVVALWARWSRHRSRSEQFSVCLQHGRGAEDQLGRHLIVSVQMHRIALGQLLLHCHDMHIVFGRQPPLQVAPGTWVLM